MSHPINNLTSVLFYPRLPISDYLEFARGFIERNDASLNFEPVILPIKGPVPPEAPRVVLRSKTSGFVCEFAINRVYFHFHVSNKNPVSIEELFPRYREALYRTLTALFEMLDLKPVRLGFLARFVFQVDRDASEALQDEFLSDERFAGAKETQLHFLHHVDMAQAPCNRWIRYRTIRSPAPESEARHALLEIDINSRIDYQHLFDQSDVIEFYLEGYEHIRQSLRLASPFIEDNEE